MSDKPNYEDLEKEVNELERQLAEQMAKEETLFAGQELYKTMFEHAGVAITVTRAKDGSLVDCNRKAYDLLGYTKEEYLNLSHEDYVMDSIEKKNRIMRELRKKGTSVYTRKVKRKNGQILDVMGSGVSIWEGKDNYYHLIWIDITEQKQTERRLAESEEKYRTILNTMNEGYYERDLGGKLIFCNSATEKILGYTYEEMLGESYNIHMTPETAKAVFKRFNRVFKTGESEKRFEYEIFKKDGSKADIEVSIAPLKNEAGDIIGFKGITRDITQRKKLDDALKEREALYRTLFDHAGFALTLTDLRTGRIVAFNQKAYEEMGYTKEEFENIDARKLSAYSEEEQIKIVNQVIQNNALTYDFQFLKKNGDFLEALCSAVIVRLGGKKYAHAIRVDVTDQKQTLEKLAESEERFRTIFEAAADGIFLCDVGDRKIVDVNQAACTYLGYVKKDLLSLSIKDITAPESLIDTDNILETIRENGSYFYNTVHLKKTGKKVSVEISSRIIEYQGKEVILSIARDVTERKQIEKELAEQRARLEMLVQKRTQNLEAAQRELIKQERLAVLGRLTATVSHELRDPLGVIQSSNDYLKRKISHQGDKMRKHLNRIEDQVAVCNAILGDLLEYTRAAYPVVKKSSIYAWLNPLLERIKESSDIHIKQSVSKNLPEIFHDQLKFNGW